MQNTLDYIIGLKKNKSIVLGVAFDWGKRKGLDVFVRLAKLLDGDKYIIVLIGTDDIVDKKISSNIISVHRTQNQPNWLDTILWRMCSLHQQGKTTILLLIWKRWRVELLLSLLTQVGVLKC